MRAACHPAGRIFRDFFFPPLSIIAFIRWPLFSLIKGIQFPSVARWYIVPDTSGSVMSSEREKRDAVECRRRTGNACAHCQSVCRADARLLSIHLSPAARRSRALEFEFGFDCHARHPQPRAHPAAPPQRDLGIWFRTLLLKGHRSGIASLSSCARRMDFDWTTLYLRAAPLLLRPLLHIIHPVADETLSCRCV